MPQYELDLLATPSPTLQRGRSAADAAARALDAAPSAIAVSDDADGQGWHRVTLAGEPAGRIRDHAARMRFRRD